MKTNIFKHPVIIGILALIFTSCFSTRDVYAQGYDEYYYENEYYENYDNRGINFNVFYNELRPHGRGITNSHYGRVWVPNAGRNFHPY